MSDLKHKNLEQLEQERRDCEKYINKLSSTLAGQKQRLKWIEHYIYEKTPQEMSIKEIEFQLGHKVIIKD